MPRATSKIGRGTLQYAYLWKLAQGMTARPVKFGTIVPDILGTSLGNDFYKTQQDLLFGLADAMREELDDLATAGCAIIQMEEPNIHLAGVQRGGAPMLPRSSSSTRSTAPSADCGARRKSGATPAGGIPRSSGLYPASQSYASALPLLNKLDVDVMTFETCANNGLDLEAIGKDHHRQEDRHRRRRSSESAGRDAGPGRGDHPEGADVHSRRAARRHQRLRVRPRRHVAPHRVLQDVAIVRGTNIVRKELGLPEAVSSQQIRVRAR